MRFGILLITALAAGPNMVVAAVPWPNEPAGSHPFLDCPFNSLGECHITGPGGAIVADATAPVSSSNVAKSTLAAGASSGGSELHYYTPQINRELFVGVMWRTNAQFQGRQVGNKLFFVRGPRVNGVFNFNDAALTGGAGRLIWGANTSAYDNSQACSAPLGATCYPNVSSGMVSIGTWTKIEVYIKSSTTITSRNGTVRWWINGVLAGNYTNINYAPDGLNEWVWSETWDGTVNPVPTVEWAHYIDHLYVSAPNFVLSLPKILNDTIPSLAQSGKSYAAYLKSSGGYAPLTWTISSGSLPGGLMLNPGTGVISGLPNTCGLHNFTVKVTDGNKSEATKSFSLNVTGTCTGTFVSGNPSSSASESFAVRASSGVVAFNFPLSQQGPCQVSIYDLSGKVVYACSGAGHAGIKIKTILKNGVYLAKLSQGAQVSMAKFNALN